VKRHFVGIWECRACKKVLAGGAWTVATTTAATVRSTVRRRMYPMNKIFFFFLSFSNSFS